MSIISPTTPITPEEERDAMEMYFCFEPFESKYGYEQINELKHSYRNITLIDVENPFIIVLLISNKLSWCEICDNIRGLISNDGRKCKHILGFIYADVQKAYNKEAEIHSRTFSVFFGLWKTVLLPLWGRCYTYNYLCAPSKIMAETDVYHILGEFAKLNSGYPSIKYFFNLRNAYNFNEDDLTPLDHTKAME